MKRLLLIGAVLCASMVLCPCATALDPPTMEGQHIYGGSGRDVCYGMARGRNTYILVGKTEPGVAPWGDARMVWVTENGGVMYDSCYHMSDYENEFRAVVPRGVCGWAAAGFFCPQGGTTEDVWLHIDDALCGDRPCFPFPGVFDWTYGGTLQDICYGMIPAMAGYLLMGSYTAATDDQDAFCLWTTSCGVSLLSLERGCRGRGANDDFVGAKQLADGYVLAGMAGRNGGDVWLVRTNMALSPVWERYYGGEGPDWAEFVDQTADGGFIIAGTTESYGAGGRDFLLIRTDASGNMLWRRTWGTTGWDECLAAIVDTAGEYVLAGYTGSPCDMALVKFNDAGELLWHTTFGGPNDDCCYALLQTPDGGYLLGGGTESYGNGGDMWLVKTTREGPRGRVTVEHPGPVDWDYRLHWISGYVNRLVFRDVCPGTHGSCCDGASSSGWHATDYSDSVVFTSPNPLTSGSLVTFRLYHPRCSEYVTWAAGDCSGEVAGPSPTCADYEAEFDRCAEQEKILRGSTVNGDQGCVLRPSNDQGWAISIPRIGCYTFDMCSRAPGGAGAWDSYLYLAYACCDSSGLIAENDDCPGVSGGLSRIDSVFLSGGTYYLLVEGHDAADEGEYAITITSCTEMLHSDQVDLGDLSACNFPTLAGNPAHELTGVAWLGPGITSEASPHVLNQDPDDDGVVFLSQPWDYCGPESVLVTVTAGPNWEQYQQEGGCLYLNAWKDGNMDGDFCDTIDCGNALVPEWIIQDVPVAPGVHDFVLLDPGERRLGYFAGVFRFRLSSRTLGPYGFGLLDTAACSHMRCGTVDRDPVGEVEDYIIQDMQTAVELTSFEAIAGDGRVTLRWVTASETDNDHFELWRDGTAIAHVPGAGTSAEEHRYTHVDRDLQNDRAYSYRLVSVSTAGVREEIGSAEATPISGAMTVTEYALHQNYPNPFNPTTYISFDLVETGVATLQVYNLAGQLLTTLANHRMDAGRHTVIFDATTLPSGVYLCKLTAGQFTATKKMLLVR